MAPDKIYIRPMPNPSDGYVGIAWLKPIPMCETDELYKAAPKVYCTRTGKPLSQPLLSIWKRKYISYAI